MTLAADDLLVGMWIVITYREIPGCSHLAVEACRTGLPLRVLAVDLPYVVVSTSDATCFAIDVRHCEVKRASESYVAAFNSGQAAPVPETAKPGHCPRCGKALRLCRPVVGAWRPFCDQCGFQGDPVPL